MASENSVEGPLVLNRPLTRQAREALTEGRRVLRDVEAGRSSVRIFDMGTWYTHADDRTQPDDPACGTAGCFLGACALDPWFGARGLRLNGSDEPECDVRGRDFTLTDVADCEIPEQFRRTAFEAGEVVFDIEGVFVCRPIAFDMPLDNYLFSPRHYVKNPDVPVADVIARIDEVLDMKSLEDPNDQAD